MTYGAKPLSSTCEVAARAGRVEAVARSAEVDVRELQREVRIHAPADERLPRVVVVVELLDGLVRLVDVVDLHVELANAAADIEAFVVLGRLARTRCSGQGAGASSCDRHCQNNCSIHIPDLLRTFGVELGVSRQQYKSRGDELVTAKRGAHASGSAVARVKQFAA